MELIPKKELASDVGSFEIPRTTIAHMATGRLHAAEKALDQLSRENPHKQFSAVSDPKKSGITFYWHNTCPTCSGPTRETVNLRCQTCGTDYGL